MKITKRQREYLTRLASSLRRTGTIRLRRISPGTWVCTETPFTRLLRTCAARAYSQIVLGRVGLSFPMIR